MKRYLKWLGGAILLFIFLSILLILPFKWIDPPTSSYMIQQKQALAEDSNESTISYEWVDWHKISDYTKMAAITSEDQRFPFHNGFDLEAIEKAIEESQQGEDLRGASTITQQVAKNMFLWPGRSFIRKGIEAYLTVLIELFWSKERILEIYLNIAEFGPGVFGVQAAAQQYFETSASSLSMGQSALMMTALPSPKRYNLADPSPYMMERRNWILRYMFLLGNTKYLENL